MTWNVEGLRRNVFNLKHFTDIHDPDIIFLSEPQIFTHDVDLVMSYLQGEYCFTLNSADKYDLDLPLTSNRAHGGTMTLWKVCHDPYVTTCSLSSPSFLPILFHPPGSPLSIHISIYLPTLGQESKFMEEIAKLSCAIEELKLSHPAAPIFLRGDFNVNDKVRPRMTLLDYFKEDQELLQLPLEHKTYHHFLGDGSSDSALDRIMFSKNLAHHETIKTIICKHADPLIESHHDMIISAWTLEDELKKEESPDTLTAPRIPNLRLKVLWNDAGIEAFQDLVHPHLSRLQNLWLSSPTKTSVSLLLESTSNILTSCASLTNKTISFATRPSSKSRSIPRHVKLSANKLLRTSKKLKKITDQFGPNSNAARSLKLEYTNSRTQHRKLGRQFKAKDASTRDQNILKNPSTTYRKLRAYKRGKHGKIHKLKVGEKVYVGDAVPDGFFDSISELKTRDTAALQNSDNFTSFSMEFSNILELCKIGSPIPPISEEKSLKLLQRMKPDVSDFYGVTPNHYIYAGPAGWNHLHVLLNALAADVSNTTIVEINTVYACIIFKGHGKDKGSSRSYRTISTCPVVAKGFDLYIRGMHVDTWNRDQAETQFQGEGSSHELTALLLTETIQHSLYSLKQPIFVLFLDAKSAFDVVLRELLIKNLFNINKSCSHSLLYLNHGLDNRQTFLDWDGQLMGPIMDEQGL